MADQPNQLLTSKEWGALSPKSRAALNRYVMDAERVARKMILNMKNGATEADIEAAGRIIESRIDRDSSDDEKQD